MTNKELNKAAKHYAEFMGGRLIRRFPVKINGIKHHWITVEYVFYGETLRKSFQVEESILNQYL